MRPHDTTKYNTKTQMSLEIQIFGSSRIDEWRQLKTNDKMNDERKFIVPRRKVDITDTLRTNSCIRTSGSIFRNQHIAEHHRVNTVMNGLTKLAGFMVGNNTQQKFNLLKLAWY